MNEPLLNVQEIVKRAKEKHTGHGTGQVLHQKARHAIDKNESTLTR